MMATSICFGKLELLFSSLVIHVRKQVCSDGSRRPSRSKTWPKIACHTLLVIPPYLEISHSLTFIEPFAPLTKVKCSLCTIWCHSSTFGTVPWHPQTRTLVPFSQNQS